MKNPLVNFLYLFSNSSITSARLIIFKTLASGTAAELTLTTSQTSSTETLAKQTLTPNKKRKRSQI
jgi:hypothetical protein